MSCLSCNFLGITIHALTIKSIQRHIEVEIKDNNRSIIANHNLHSLYIYHKSLKMREFYSKSKYTHIDGMSLVFLGKLLGANIERKNRITYIDWIYPLMQEAAEKNYRVLFLGSKPGIAAKAASILKIKIDSLELETMHGYFDPTPDCEQNKQVLQRIKEYKPHILMVGMGMPRQEYWIFDNLDNIEANIILTAGACMDLVAGEIATPPRWMGRIGLDWFYRLLTEPKRVWKRYLIEPWFVLRLFCREFFRNWCRTGQ
ncbi:MAG: glycosyl transferase [Clostridiaceae bacterium BRH_c20a]|nr:MAG: glycosyl transferase [Clostridiaceae bacterium BRH_c20a]